MGERGRLAASPWSPSCPRASLPLRPGRLSRVPGSGAAGPPGRVPRSLACLCPLVSLSPTTVVGREGEGRATGPRTGDSDSHPPTHPTGREHDPHEAGTGRKPPETGQRQAGNTAGEGHPQQTGGEPRNAREPGPPPSREGEKENERTHPPTRDPGRTTEGTRR